MIKRIEQLKVAVSTGGQLHIDAEAAAELLQEIRYLEAGERFWKDAYEEDVVGDAEVLRIRQGWSLGGLARLFKAVEKTWGCGVKMEVKPDWLVLSLGSADGRDGPDGPDEGDEGDGPDEGDEGDEGGAQ